MQNLETNALPLVSPILSRQDAQLARLETESISRRKLARLVRRNSLSVLTSRNRVEIQQDAAKFYPNFIEDIKAAQDSIHLQYFILAVDPFTESLKQIHFSQREKRRAARADLDLRAGET